MHLTPNIRPNTGAVSDHIYILDKNLITLVMCPANVPSMFMLYIYYSSLCEHNDNPSLGSYFVPQIHKFTQSHVFLVLTLMFIVNTCLHLIIL